MNLSKSRYTAALQCPKKLWMDSFKPELADDSAAAVFAVGNEVGDLAREYFGNYVLADFDAGFESMTVKDRICRCRFSIHCTFSAHRVPSPSTESI